VFSWLVYLVTNGMVVNVHYAEKAAMNNITGMVANVKFVEDHVIKSIYLKAEYVEFVVKNYIR
jgi:hypothetical protein